MFAAKSCTNDANIKVEDRPLDIWHFNLPEGEFNKNFAKGHIANINRNSDNYSIYQKGDTIWAYNKADNHLRYQFIRVENLDQ
jgi:hypothetical protein